MSWGLLGNRGDRTIDRRNKQCEPGGGKNLGHVGVRVMSGSGSCQGQGHVRVRQTLPVKGHTVNVSGFVAQMVPVSSIVAL